MDARAQLLLPGSVPACANQPAPPPIPPARAQSEASVDLPEGGEGDMFDSLKVGSSFGNSGYYSQGAAQGSFSGAYTSGYSA